MFTRTATMAASAARSAPTVARMFSTGAGHNVAVLGAAGGIGQPLSLLLKTSGAVSHLRCFDIVNTPGVAADLSHCSTRGTVTGHVGDDELGDALTGCDVVVIPAGVPRKPGMTRDDLFNTNASIVKSLAAGAAKHCPDAHLLIISNPVNSTVPIVAETLKAAKVYNPRKLYGVTTLDVVRANTFMGAALGKDPEDVNVTVIGGHAGTTILPLLSRVPGFDSLSDEEVAALSHRIQFGGDEVVKAKDGAGSATLSMAYAGAKFTLQLLRALGGETGITECAFVESDAVEGAAFFSTPVELTADGVGKVHPVGELSAFEQENFDAMLPDLKAQIAKGVAFAAQ